MPTLLTNAKMDPALAARVEGSVTGKRPGPTKRRPGLVAFARVAAVLVVIFVVQSVVGFKRREHDELGRVRGDLLRSLHAHTDTLGDAEKKAPQRMEEALVALARPSDGEKIAPELVREGALDAVLGRPIVYVRGPLANFASSKLVAPAAEMSSKDAFVLCLLHPPSSRAEKDVLSQVRIAYGRDGGLDAVTSNVRRLHEAESAAPFFAPKLLARVESSSDFEELASIKKDLAHAALDPEHRALKATLLLAVFDEPGEGSGPTELDGERRHPVRVTLLDLASSSVLLSTRRTVDPSWVSAAKRPEYAAGLDSCLLAMDVRAAVAAK